MPIRTETARATVQDGRYVYTTDPFATYPSEPVRTPEFRYPIRSLEYVDFSSLKMPDNEVLFKRIIKDHNISKTITIGTLGQFASCTSTAYYEGFARILNLMRTFVGIGKKEAIFKSSQGWKNIDDDIEYLFRYFGLGFEADVNGEELKPILFQYPNRKGLIKVEKSNQAASWILLELPDRKLLKIAKRIKSIMEDPKCYKELQEHRGKIMTIIDTFERIGATDRRDRRITRALYGAESDKPHVYIQIKAQKR